MSKANLGRDVVTELVEAAHPFIGSTPGGLSPQQARLASAVQSLLRYFDERQADPPIEIGPGGRLFQRYCVGGPEPVKVSIGPLLVGCSEFDKQCPGGMHYHAADDQPAQKSGAHQKIAALAAEVRALTQIASESPEATFQNMVTAFEKMAEALGVWVGER